MQGGKGMWTGKIEMERTENEVCTKCNSPFTDSVSGTESMYNVPS